MIASLPMYWRAENAAAWRAMWADVQAAGRRHGLALPDLTAPEDIPQPWTDHWLRGDLILSQACSMPLRTTLRDSVIYVGTLDFGVSGRPGFYNSVLITKSANADVRRLAVNGYDSQSGYVAGLDPLVGTSDETAYARRATEHLMTGAHRASLKVVSEAQADGAYLDAVSHRLCEVFDPEAAQVHVAGHTPDTPGLPLITARGRDPGSLRATLQNVFAAKPAWLSARELGGLQGFVVLEEAVYLDLPVPDGSQNSAAVVE